MHTKKDYVHAATISDIPIYVCVNQRKWNIEHPGTLAYMFNDKIYVKSKKYFTPSVLAHELTHVKQKRRIGSEFKYRLKLLWARQVAAVVAGRETHNDYEFEAMRVEQEFRNKTFLDVANHDWDAD